MFESESLYHILVECPHPSMVFCRGRLKHDVMEPSRSEEAILQSSRAPAFDQSEMWAVIMLCTSSVSFPVQPQMADPLHRPWAQHEVTPVEKAVPEGICAGVTTDMTGIVLSELFRGYNRSWTSGWLSCAAITRLVRLQSCQGLNLLTW